MPKTIVAKIYVTDDDGNEVFSFVVRNVSKDAVIQQMANIKNTFTLCSVNYKEL